MVGQASHSATLLTRAFLWENGVMKDLGTLLDDDQSSAFAINQAGKVVGGSWPKYGECRAVMWQGGAIQNLGGLPGWNNHRALDINDKDQVVGTSCTGSACQGFLWDKGTIRGLGPFPGSSYTIPQAINNRGQVVGHCLGAPAWIWENGVFSDLNKLIPADSGWVLVEAKGIDDAGQIVGYGTIQGQMERTFLLTPTAVPGPGPAIRSLLLLD